MTRTIEVHPLRLFVQSRHARLMADHGMGLARNAGTVRSIAAEYAIEGVRTWSQLADRLDAIADDVRVTLDKQLDDRAADHA